MQSELSRILDQYFLVRTEKAVGKGEDSFLLAIEENAWVAGVFDGCGGSGARIYPTMGNHTGAYIASRILAEETWNWFSDWEKRQQDGIEGQNNILKERINSALQVYRNRTKGSSQLTGSLTKDFPSTLAVSVVHFFKDQLIANFFWSGDSRGYILDSNGMHQMTEDDLPDSDAMKNLTEDAPMINVVSASKPYKIHQRSYLINQPSIVFSATDGCFGYFRTPMEFEKMILMCLEKAESISKWKELINESLKEIAGDDFTMSVLIFGFGGFGNIQKCLKKRLQFIQKRYPLTEQTEYEEIYKQWEEYRLNYEWYRR